MRVLVVSDSVAGLTPRAASETIAQAFHEQGAEVAVIPVGTGGGTLADALSTLAMPVDLAQPDSVAAVLEALCSGHLPLVLDLTALEHPSLDQLVEVFTSELVEELRHELGHRDLVAVVPEGQEDRGLVGLNGTLAEQGRLRGDDLAQTIAADSRAEQWARHIGADPTAPGSGAAGGLGAVVLAVGGRVVNGLGHCLAGYAADQVMRRADLVVTGAAELDFHALGGPVVKMMAERAADAQRPLVAIAGRTFVSPRELRVAGIEAAHAVLPGAGDETPDRAQLLDVARRVAITWRW